MARAPRAKVSKTSGQGVSRLSYQKGYALGNRGSAKSEGASVPSPSKSDAPDTKAPRGGKMKGDSNLNVSYGETLPISDIKDVEGYAKGKPPQSNVFRQGKSLNLADKGRSAYAKK